MLKLMKWKGMDVEPSKVPLQLGQGDYKTQEYVQSVHGLRPASGHCVQALVGNLDAFIGEGLKVPYVLRMFMAPEQQYKAMSDPFVDLCSRFEAVMVVDADACFNKGVNKMDCDTAAYKQNRFDVIANVIKSMLLKLGWENDLFDENVPVLSFS